jgi:ferredoxin
MIAPTVFDQDEEDGTVILLQSQPPDEFGELVRRAEQVCPALAIRVAG